MTSGRPRREPETIRIKDNWMLQVSDWVQVEPKTVLVKRRKKFPDLEIPLVWVKQNSPSSQCKRELLLSKACLNGFFLDF